MSQTSDPRTARTDSARRRRFLHKPFSVDELLQAVRAALDQVA
jgi:DNA-binding response OmpR family regulator